MLFKEILYWNGKDWKKLKIKTDSLKVITKGYEVNILDDRDVKKVEINSLTEKDMRGKPKGTFVAFLN